MDPYLLEVFPSPPRVSFKRTKNIKDYLVCAKVPSSKINQFLFFICVQPVPTSRKINLLSGMTLYGRLRKRFNCYSSNVIYLIECNKDECKARYIGMSDREVRKRISEHLGYLKGKMFQEQ